MPTDHTPFHEKASRLAAGLAKLTAATKGGFDNIDKSLRRLQLGPQGPGGPGVPSVPANPAVFAVLGALGAATHCVAPARSKRELRACLAQISADEWAGALEAVRSLRLWAEFKAAWEGALKALGFPDFDPENYWAYLEKTEPAEAKGAAERARWAKQKAEGLTLLYQFTMTVLERGQGKARAAR